MFAAREGEWGRGGRSGGRPWRDRVSTVGDGGTWVEEAAGWAGAAVAGWQGEGGARWGRRQRRQWEVYF